MKVIDKVKWYRPREVAKLGLIKNSIDSQNEDSNYTFILNQIKAGRLAARNYSTGGKLPYYLVSERAIKEYYKLYV